MAAPLDIPFNLTLLELTPAKLQHLRPVKVLDSFDELSPGWFVFD
jgi:hypothetical protein